VVLLLGVHVAVWIGFATLAVRDPSFAVEPDHYGKSLRWDAAAAQHRASEMLGWKVKIQTALETGIGGKRRLQCHLTDRGGKPVTGARVELVTFHHARGNDRVKARLVEETEGVYAGQPRMRRAGVWECRLEVHRDQETFTHVLTHFVSEPDGEEP
jgi:nitrogen fixation protein FixH